MADPEYPDNISILDLENTLKCPVCFELRDGRIFVCQRGHHLCEVCSRSLHICPTCQCGITGCRNFVAETLISKYGFLKLESEQSHNNATGQLSNSTEDSTVDESVHSASASEESSMPDTQKTLVVNNTYLKSLDMSSGIFPCNLASCNASKPNFGVGAMIPHLRNTHGNIMHYIHHTYATLEFTSPRFLYKTKRKFNQAYHISNMGVFFFYITVLKDGYINMWITMVAASSVAYRFQYEISLYVTDPAHFCTSFVGQVHPCGADKNWLLERNEIMVVPPSQHQLLLDQSFEMDVTIVYK